MEIYKDLSNPASQEFEKLLNSQLSKIQIEEGKIIEGKINKITEKFVFLFVEGLKSEPVLDINELKEILTDSRILKVFHSARQDIEVLMNTYNIIPWPIYDTQIAANFIYEDNDIGYGNLVEKICSKKLNKKYQVSDWSRRPLKNKQIEYCTSNSSS